MTTLALLLALPILLPLPARAASPVDNSNHLYVVDGWGGVHPAGNSPALGISGYWQGWDIVRGMALFADGSGGYTLDGFGGLHSVGSAPSITDSQHNYWPGWDIARAVVMAPWATPSAPAGWVLDGFGGISAFGGAPGVPGNHAYWSGWDIARAIVVFPDSTPDASAGYLLDGFGGVHGWSAGNAANPGEAHITGYWPGWDIARSMALINSSTRQGFVMDGYGGFHGFAPEGTALPPSPGSYAYWPGWDIARSITTWTAAPAGSPGGWTLDAYGALHPFGSAPNVTASAYWSGWEIARGSSGAGSGSGARPITSRVLDVPFYRQVYALSCEAAALQMALASRGISSNQTDIMTNIGIDYRGSYRDGNGFHWGDPYTSFVGNPSGSENNLSGYGTYFPTIASVAQRYGASVRFANEGYPPAAVYNDLLNGHPVVVWVSVDYAWHGNWVYTAFDGRPVQFGAPYEHAVIATGVAPDSILINDPFRGRIWMSKGTFERAYGVFGGMAVSIN